MHVQVKLIVIYKIGLNYLFGDFACWFLSLINNQFNADPFEYKTQNINLFTNEWFVVYFEFTVQMCAVVQSLYIMFDFHIKFFLFFLFWIFTQSPRLITL